jgi:hypothetical protein
VATKYCEDIFETNTFYGRVGGILTAEVNVLEVEFLFQMNFQLGVSESEYETYVTFLKVASQLNSGVSPNLQDRNELLHKMGSSSMSNLIFHRLTEQAQNEQQHRT